MKLYLSSYHLGNESAKFIKMFSDNKTIAVIANAMDFVNEAARKESLNGQINDLAKLGLFPEEIDLRNYFQSPVKLKEGLSKYAAIWVKGGNTFILRRAMFQSGLDKIILEKNKNPCFIYGGYSAGICILAPTLKGLEIVDNPTEVSKGYNKKIIWEGLGIIDYSIAPHYKSDHPESFKVDKTVEYFIKNNMPFKTLRDGEVIIKEK